MKLLLINYLLEDIMKKPYFNSIKLTKIRNSIFIALNELLNNVKAVFSPLSSLSLIRNKTNITYKSFVIVLGLCYSLVG